MLRRLVLALAAALLPAAAHAADAAWLIYPAGNSIYVRIYTSSSTAVAAAMTAGTSGNTRRYAAVDATIGTAGMNSVSAGVYPCEFFLSATPSTTAADPPVGAGVIRWGGSASVDPLPNVAAGAAGGLATYSAQTTAATILAKLDAAFASSGVFSTAALANGPASSATAITVNQAAVSANRTWLLVATNAAALKGDRTLTMKVGETPPFALDWRNDLAANGRLTSFDTMAIVTGTTGGVTFSNKGVDKAQSKLTITAVTAGTYVLKATVTADDSDGGGVRIAQVTLVVTD